MGGTSDWFFNITYFWFIEMFPFKLGLQYILGLQISISYIWTFGSVKCPLKWEGWTGVTLSTDAYPGLRQDCLSLSFLGGNHRSLVWLTTRTELLSTTQRRRTQLKTNGLVSFYRERLPCWATENIFLCKAVTMPHKHTFAHTFTSTHAYTQVCITKSFKASLVPHYCTGWHLPC